MEISWCFFFCKFSPSVSDTWLSFLCHAPLTDGLTYRYHWKWAFSIAMLVYGCVYLTNVASENNNWWSLWSFCTFMNWWTDHLHSSQITTTNDAEDSSPKLVVKGSGNPPQKCLENVPIDLLSKILLKLTCDFSTPSFGIRARNFFTPKSFIKTTGRIHLPPAPHLPKTHGHMSPQKGPFKRNRSNFI